MCRTSYGRFGWSRYNSSCGSCLSKARFPFKRNRLRCVRCVNENRNKRKRLHWQAANHGCHCFDRAFLLAGACVCCVKFSQALAFIAVFVYATHAMQAIAFEWKPGLTCTRCLHAYVCVCLLMNTAVCTLVEYTQCPLVHLHGLELEGTLINCSLL